MATAWYVERAGEQPVGPLSASQLKRLADDGKLKPTDRVRKDDGAWVAAASVKGLFSAAGAPAASSSEPLPPEPQPVAPEREPKKPKGLWDRVGDAVKDAAGQVQKAADAARASMAKPAPEPEADEAPRKPKKRRDDDEAEPPRERTAKPKLPPKQVLILGAVGGGCLLLLMVGAVVALVVAGAGTSTDSAGSPPGGGSKGGGSQEMTRQQFREKIKSIGSMGGKGPKWDGRNRSAVDGAGTPLLTSDVEAAVGKPAATRTVGSVIVWTWLCKDGVVSVEANQESGALPLIKPDGTRYREGEILWVLAVNDQ